MTQHDFWMILIGAIAGMLFQSTIGTLISMNIEYFRKHRNDRLDDDNGELAAKED